MDTLKMAKGIGNHNMLDHEIPDALSEVHASATQAAMLPGLAEQRQHFISHLPEGEIGVGLASRVRRCTAEGVND